MIRNCYLALLRVFSSLLPACSRQTQQDCHLSYKNLRFTSSHAGATREPMFLLQHQQIPVQQDRYEWIFYLPLKFLWVMRKVDPTCPRSNLFLEERMQLKWSHQIRERRSFIHSWTLDMKHNLHCKGMGALIIIYCDRKRSFPLYLSQGSVNHAAK